jgi:hypothetical protein
VVRLCKKNHKTLKVFRAPHKEKKTISADTESHAQDDDDVDTKTQEACSFRNRFVDSMLGKRMLEEAASSFSVVRLLTKCG